MEIEITFILNQQVIHTKVNPATVLLDFIRKEKKLTGTKEVCKEGDCGACAVLLGEIFENKVKYKTINSCLYPIQKVSGKHVVTIEGLNQENLNPIQESFIAEGASQCGFCTPGFIVSTTGYLLNSLKYQTNEAVNAIAGNICRCTGYNSIKRSIEKIISPDEKITLDSLIEKNIVPSYLKEIPSILSSLGKQSAKKSVINKNKVTYISGGTDLFVQQPDELLKRKVEFIDQIVTPNITINENRLQISGSATIEELKYFLNSNKTNLNLDKLFRLFASQPIRNSATLAGNIINASPIADLTISLLALDANLTLQNTKRIKRDIALNKFYSGYKTFNKANDEIISEISFELPNPNSFFNFEKVSKRKHLDIASVNTAICIDVINNKIMQASISAGGVSPIPLYLEKTSSFLNGKHISLDLILEVVKSALTEINPISDIRGSTEYKSLLLSQLIKAHFLELFPQIITAEVLE